MTAKQLKNNFKEHQITTSLPCVSGPRKLKTKSMNTGLRPFKLS